MKTCLLLFVIAASFSVTTCLQCASGVDNSFRPGSIGYNYSGLSNLKVVQGFACGDNSCAYTVSNGLVSSSDYSVLSKLDSLLNNVWANTLPGLISKFGIKMTNDESSLIFTVYSTSSCKFAKINTVDGLFSNQKLVSSANQCLSLTLSSDNVYAYFTTVSVSLSYICRIFVSNLSMVDSKLHSSLNIVSIYSYGASNVLINSISTLSSTYQIAGVDMSISLGAKLFGVKFGCTLSCSISTTQILSLIWTPTGTSYQLALENGLPVFLA